jgi:hypothetical protein
MKLTSLASIGSLSWLPGLFFALLFTEELDDLSGLSNLTSIDGACFSQTAMH